MRSILSKGILRIGQKENVVNKVVFMKRSRVLYGTADQIIFEPNRTFSYTISVLQFRDGFFIYGALNAYSGYFKTTRSTFQL